MPEDIFHFVSTFLLPNVTHNIAEAKEKTPGPTDHCHPANKHTDRPLPVHGPVQPGQVTSASSVETGILTTTGSRYLRSGFIIIANNTKNEDCLCPATMLYKN